MKKIIFLLALCLVGQKSYAQIRDFQTTRLNSTAGTGVASILSTEAAILNPAAAAYFDDSSFSYQRINTNLNHKNEIRDTVPDQFTKDNKSEGIFMADQGGPVKGGVSYITQHENGYQRKRTALHGAATISKETAMGVSYRYTQDTRPGAFFSKRHKTFHQASVGMVHILDVDTILGLVVVDPTRTNPGDERVIGGFQYNLADKFTIMGDAGFQYTKAYTKKYQWNAALQLNIFQDFFLRAGRFYDNVREFKGMGWGVAWLGPRLGVEFAQKFSERIGTTSYLYPNESLIDTSLSAIIKF